jgi:hypothetical protein
MAQLWRSCVDLGLERRAACQEHPQAPPQQPPPPDGPDDIGAEKPPRPVRATVERSFTVSSWPCGHATGDGDAVSDRVTSNVSPQARHR